MNYVWESDYLLEESKKKLIHESFKIDSNEMLNQDKKFKEGKLSDLMSYLEQYKKKVRRWSRKYISTDELLKMLHEVLKKKIKITRETKN